MKKYFFLLIAFALLLSCSSSDKVNNNNPYLPNYSFTVDINMNLPLYSILLSPGNAIYYPNVGIRGIFVFNTGSSYVAFDAACPNQTLATCSTMTLNGINAVCACQKEQYLLYTGQSTGQKYPMKPYKVQVNDNNSIRVYN